MIAAKRNLQLDFLRGIAILMVIGRHLELDRPAGLVGVIADVWFRLGWLGVDLFFVLSGFLIGGLLLSEFQKHGSIDVPRFLFRRGLKIYPPYFVFLSYLILVPTAKALRNGADSWSVFANECARYWPNFLFLQNYVGTNPAGHTWTLAVEEHFYLLLPFALAGVVAIRRIQWLIPGALAVVPICLGLRFLSVWTNDPFAAKLSASHLRLDALLFGVAIRGFAQFAPSAFAAARAWRPALILAGVVSWTPHAFIEPSNFWVRTVGLTGTFLGSAAFLVAAYHTHALDFGRFAFVASRVAGGIAGVGVFSYGIYLWHITALGILERMIASRVFGWFGGATAPAWFLAVIVVSSGAILVGIVASKVVEWPVLHLRDRFFPSRSGSLPFAKASVDVSRPTADSASAQPFRMGPVS